MPRVCSPHVVSVGGFVVVVLEVVGAADGRSMWATRAVAKTTARVRPRIFFRLAICSRLLPSVTSHGGRWRGEGSFRGEPPSGHPSHPFLRAHPVRTQPA